MRWTHLLLPALVGCASTPDDEGPEPDPHAQTIQPEGYAPDAPTRLIFLGDSITAGAGATRASLAYPGLLDANDDSRWPTYAGLDLTTAFPSITEVIDVSEGGATTATMESLQLPALEAELGSLPAAGQTIVVYTIGGNDAQNALNPLADPADVVDRALGRYEAIVDWFLDPAHFEDVRVYATNIYEPSDGIGQVDDCFFGFDYAASLPELDRFNDEVADMARDKGFAAVDLRGHFLGHGFYHDQDIVAEHQPEDPTLWLAEDCIHPNNRGHHELRRLFFHAILGEPLPYATPFQAAASDAE